MNAIITIDKTLQLWEACADNNTRPWLQGVYINAEGRAVATDGFMAAFAKLDVELLNEDLDAVNVPGRFLKQAFKLTPRYDRYVKFRVQDGLAITLDESYREPLIIAPSGTTSLAPSALKIPSAKRCDTGNISFNYKLLGRLGKAIGRIGQRGIETIPMVFNGSSSPIYVPGSPSVDKPVFGVLMPMFMAVDDVETTFAKMADVCGWDNELTRVKKIEAGLVAGE